MGNAFTVILLNRTGNLICKIMDLPEIPKRNDTIFAKGNWYRVLYRSFNSMQDVYSDYQKFDGPTIIYCEIADNCSPEERDNRNI